MRPAFSSRTKRRGATALAPALRLVFLTASDMWHPYGDLTRNWSALDRDCAANTCHDIEWDDRRWNGCASSSLSYGARFVPLLNTYSFRPLLRGRNAEVGALGRVSAAEIESAIFTTIQSYRGPGDSDARTDPFRDVERVVLARDPLLITTVGSGGAEGGRDPR